MKKRIATVMGVCLAVGLVLLGVVFLWGLDRGPTTCPLSVMIDGTVYYTFSEKSDVTPTQEQISGYIRSCEDISGMPKKDDQSNFSACVDQPYAFVEGQLLLYYSGQWNLCELP